MRIGDVSTGVEGEHKLLRGRVAEFAYFDERGGAEVTRRSDDGYGAGSGLTPRAFWSGQKVGVAPKAALYVAVALGRVITSIARVLGSLNWMLENDVRVVNLSVRHAPGFSAAFEAVIAVLHRRDVVCVAAVGNEGPGTSRSPGNYRDVISVGAIDAHDEVAAFSSSQKFSVKSESDYSVPSVVAERSEYPFGDRQVSPFDPHRHLIGIGSHCGSRSAASPGSTTRQRCRHSRRAVSTSSKKPRGQSPIRVGHGIPDGVEAIRHLARKGLIDGGFLARWSP